MAVDRWTLSADDFARVAVPWTTAYIHAGSGYAILADDQRGCGVLAAGTFREAPPFCFFTMRVLRAQPGRITCKRCHSKPRRKRLPRKLGGTPVYIHDGSGYAILADVAGTTPASGAYHYYLRDNIGSTRALYDQSKAKLGSYEFSPYGIAYANAGTNLTHMYTGHDWDSTARLYYTMYRFYNPDQGRWLSRDPAGMVDGPNVYAYCQASPISSIDPDGKQAIPIQDAIRFLVNYFLLEAIFIMALAFIMLGWTDGAIIALICDALVVAAIAGFGGTSITGLVLARLGGRDSVTASLGLALQQITIFWRFTLFHLVRGLPLAVEALFVGTICNKLDEEISGWFGES